MREMTMPPPEERYSCATPTYSCKEKKIDFEIKNNIDFSKPHQSQLDEETRKLINDGKQ